MDFVDFKWISGFPVDFSRFLDFRLDFCDVVRDFARIGPLADSYSLTDYCTILQKLRSCVRLSYSGVCF